jgi:predicted dehydrogenase
MGSDDAVDPQGPLSLAILGLGHIGTVHLQSARALSGVTVDAVADVVPDNRKRAANLGVPNTYDDFEALLADESTDVVVVALPPSLHADAVEAAARAGSDVFVEKPFARTVQEATEMIEIADREGVTLGVDHTLRYHPEIRRAKRRYERGSLGHVPTCVVSRINSGPFDTPPAEGPIAGWALDPAATGGGALMDLGVHLLDVLRWLFGDLTVEHAELSSQLDLGFEDTAVVVLRATETGTIATVVCGFFQWETPPEINLNVRLDGVADYVDSSSFVPDRFALHAARAAIGNLTARLTGGDPRPLDPTYYYRAHYRALRDFLTAVAEARPPPVGPRDGLRTIELVADTYDLAG